MEEFDLASHAVTYRRAESGIREVQWFSIWQVTSDKLQAYYRLKMSFKMEEFDGSIVDTIGQPLFFFCYFLDSSPLSQIVMWLVQENERWTSK